MPRGIPAKLIFRGLTKSESAWARAVGINLWTLRRRLKAGWSLKKAFSPPRKYGQWRNGYGKYSEQQISEAVRKSTSFMAALLMLGANPRAGSTHSALKKRILELGIDTSHFFTPRERALARIKSGQHVVPNKKHWSKVLILKPDGSFKCPSHVRRRAMVECGVPEQCVDCGLGKVWNGKSITLQVDHVNGKNLDDRRKNLAFRCPNCHSQTKNYGNRSRKSRVNALKEG